MSKNFKNYYIINAAQEQIYKALTTATTATLWTGEPAQIDAVEGGTFSLWDGSITGHFVSLEPFSKIVQEWYFGEDHKDSIVTIKFHTHKRGTSLEIRHDNIPDEAYDDIVEGWNEVFVPELIDFYEGEEL